MAFSCLMGFILVGDTFYIRRLFQEAQEKRDHFRETAKNGTTRQTTKSLNHIFKATIPATEIPTSIFVQFPSRKQLLSNVAKAIQASKKTAWKRRFPDLRNNSNIWSSFWTNEKPGKLKSEPRELALYDEEINGRGEEKIQMEKSKQTNVISKQSETGGEINWRLSHLKP